MALLKRGKTWFIDYYYPPGRDGKRVREKVGTSKDDARIVLAERLKDIRQEEPGASPDSAEAVQGDGRGVSGAAREQAEGVPLGQAEHGCPGQALRGSDAPGDHPEADRGLHHRAP